MIEYKLTIATSYYEYLVGRVDLHSTSTSRPHEGVTPVAGIEIDVWFTTLKSFIQSKSNAQQHMCRLMCFRLKGLSIYKVCKALEQGIVLYSCGTCKLWPQSCLSFTAEIFYEDSLFQESLACIIQALFPAQCYSLASKPGYLQIIKTQHIDLSESEQGLYVQAICILHS